MNGEPKETSFKAMFQSMIPNAADLLQGTVTSIKPLKIQIANDSKLIISKLSAVIPRHLTDYKVTAEISDSFSKNNTIITVHNALKVGEKVHLIALQNGKKYFVLDRV